MTIVQRGKKLFILLLLAGFDAQRPARAQTRTTSSTCAAPSERVDTTFARSRFTFQSRFWLNLHQFLYAQAQARAGFSHRVAITSSLDDTVGYGSLEPAARAAWEHSLSYYLRAVAPRDFLFDSTSINSNNYLATIPDSAVPGAALAPELVEALRASAPIYRAHWWPVHNADNRAWIAAVKGLLACYGFKEATRVTRAFRAAWPATPLLVNVSAYAGWAGAYTTEDPGHIVISSRAIGNQGVNAIASLFHESLHTMDHNVVEALRLEGIREGVSVPYDVTHALIFYTASEATHRAIPRYSGFDSVSGAVWTRPPMMAYLPAIRRWWQPYLEGRADFSHAIARLVAALKPILQSSH